MISKRYNRHNVMEFGKCKGQSLEYAIINNPKYIKELLDGNLIKIDTRSAELLNSKLELIK